MNEQPESPFFPVPVRWFELPMNSARWGFMRLADLTESLSESPKPKRAESPSPAMFSLEGRPASKVGKLLNERA